MKRYLLLLLATFIITVADAQSKRKSAQYNFSNRENPFLQQQWWIGLKGGANFTSIDVEKSYSVILPTNYSSDQSGKVYEKWKPVASQIGLEITYFFKGFSASIQPTFKTIRYSYENSYSWVDTETPSNMLDLNYAQEAKVSYIYLPLIFKYEINLNGITPYIQAGVYDAFLIDATKSVTVSGVDYASGGTNEFSFEPVIVGAKDLYAKSHYGFIAGAGLYYNIGNVRLDLDIQYQIGQSLINSTENRYQNDRLSGIGDAMDDMKVNNIAISIGALFPLRFLSSGFKSYDK